MNPELTALCKQWVIKASNEPSKEKRIAMLNCAKDLLQLIRENYNETIESVDDLTEVVTERFGV